MHTEHLQNVRFVWVVSGWLVAFAVTSLLLLVLSAFDLVGGDDAIETLWVALSIAAGFWAGGFSIGFRAAEAPILHGIAVGLASLVAWFAVNIAALALFEAAEWEGLSPAITAGLLLVQMAAAVGGAWAGHNVALRGVEDVGPSK